MVLDATWYYIHEGLLEGTLNELHLTKTNKEELYIILLIVMTLPFKYELFIALHSGIHVQ
jgi:hypothetical protein